MISPITDWNRKFKNLANTESSKEIVVAFDKGKKYAPKVFKTLIPLTYAQEVERYVATFVYNRAYAVGAKKIFVFSDSDIYEKIRSAFNVERANGDPLGQFHHIVPFLSRIYEEKFEICRASINFIAPERTAEDMYPRLRHQVGNPKKGTRIGVDMGGSDIKVVALENGELKYHRKMNWNPRSFKNSIQHYQIIDKMVESAIDGANFKKLDGIGISTAGVVVDSRIMISGLFRSLDADEFDQKIKPMDEIISERFGKIPVHVLHDGDAAAIWAYFDMGLSNVLGLAFGTGLGAGYADENGNLAGYLCEVGKSILDMSPDAPEHIYNHTHGPALHYLSQNAVFRLAEEAGIELDQFDELAEKLRYVQRLANSGNPKVERTALSVKALEIFEKIGKYLAVAVTEFYDYFEMQNVVIFGRVTSGVAGEIILKNAEQELERKFPEIASKVKIYLPSTPPGRDAEVSREFGQAIAAAYFSSMQAS